MLSKDEASARAVNFFVTKTTRTRGRIVVLLFDLMDTVVVDPYHRLIADLLPAGMSFEEWRSLRDRGAFEDFEKGRIDEAEYLRRFYLPDVPPQTRSRLTEARVLKERLYERIDFIPGMEALLRRVTPECRLALGSNYGVWYHEVLRLRPEIAQLFPIRFFSCELGVRKPDAEYYEQVQTRLQTGEIAFIDDRPENLRLPARMGWKCHRFQGTEALAAWLSSLRCLQQ